MTTSHIGSRFPSGITMTTSHIGSRFASETNRTTNHTGLRESSSLGVRSKWRLHYHNKPHTAQQDPNSIIDMTNTRALQVNTDKATMMDKTGQDLCKSWFLGDNETRAVEYTMKWGCKPQWIIRVSCGFWESGLLA